MPIFPRRIPTLSKPKVMVASIGLAGLASVLYYQSKPKKAIIIAKKDEFGEKSICNDTTKELLMKMCKTQDSRRAQIMYKEFVTLTRHYNGDRCIDLTLLNEKYGNVMGLDKLDISNYDKDVKGTFYRIILSHLDGKFCDSLYEKEDTIRNEYTIDNIKKKCKNVITSRFGKEDEKLQNDLYTTFVTYTKHSHDDTIINLTKLMDAYGISSEELFHVLYTTTGTFGIGALSYDPKHQKNLQLKDVHEIFVKHGYHFDWYNGVPIKASFRKKEGDEQLYGVRTLNKRGGDFYGAILVLLSHKIFPKST